MYVGAVFFPLLGACLAGLFGRWLGDRASQWVTVAFMALAAACGIGAFIEVETANGRACYFLGPRAGGTEIMHGRREVLVITPQSPLGQQLVGKKQGDRWEVRLGGVRSRCRIASVT